jgi:hypothetical protein
MYKFPPLRTVPSRALEIAGRVFQVQILFEKAVTVVLGLGSVPLFAASLTACGLSAAIGLRWVGLLSCGALKRMPPASYSLSR